MTLETVTGTLAEAYKLLCPESILHADELMKKRRLHPITSDGDLRHQRFYTADGEIYFLQGQNRTPTLAITRGSSNPLFKDSTIDAYCQQLTKNHNYHPTIIDIGRALSASDTVVVDLTKLKLQKLDEEFSYLAIDTQKYKKLNSEEQKLAMRVYGKGKDFGLTMEMLAKVGIRETEVHVLNPDYVRTHATKISLGRASWLDYFSDISQFLAVIPDVYDHLAMRGVRREDVARSAGARKRKDALQSVRFPKMEEVLDVARPYIAQQLHSKFKRKLAERYKP